MMSWQFMDLMRITLEVISSEIIRVTNNIETVDNQNSIE